MSSQTIIGRPPQRTEHIVRELRGKITRGDLLPGVQLPTRIEIEQLYGASSVTVQRALQQLQRDGFVKVNGRQGTFVSETPPHLTNYALVFPNMPGKEGWNRFFGALSFEAPSLASSMGRQISVYYGADSHLESGDYPRLLEDVKAHRLGGIIFASIPNLVVGTPVLEEPKVPRVAIMVPKTEYDFPVINLDGETMWQRAADILLERDRRNLALLLTTRTPEDVKMIVDKFRKRGFNVPAKWVQALWRDYSEFASNVTQLLFDNPNHRPDALFITDDNLVEHALAGLIEAGVRVPDDVEVVAHCNFPHPVPASVPVHRLGYDARRILQGCFDILDSQQAGHEVLPVTNMPALFEKEAIAG